MQTNKKVELRAENARGEYYGVDEVVTCCR